VVNFWDSQNISHNIFKIIVINNPGSGAGYSYNIPPKYFSSFKNPNLKKFSSYGTGYLIPPNYGNQPLMNNYPPSYNNFPPNNYPVNNRPGNP